SNDLKNFKDTLEYKYRYARIFHEWGKTDKAIKFYDEVINIGADEKYYFAANSALKSGMIFESRNDFAKARDYYNKCLSLDFDEYKTSITQKAKAGLNRVKGK
ncbi:MAG: tetratricopeptide repeat protein, partial [Bacteroidales bacterium]|nr:tetratricopeptide repeat protein [Bacteroidales bacterium]